MAVKFFSNGIWKNSESHVTVAVFERRKYARVDWDFFRLPEENDQFFKDHADELMKAVKQIYIEFANEKSVFDGDGLAGQMESMMIDSAHLAAEKISALFDHYVLLRKKCATQA